MDKVQQAIRLAENAHRGQFRKYSNEQYIVHPVQVHNVLCEFLSNMYDPTVDDKEKYERYSIRLRCAALLHDVLEDCPQISEQDIIDATDISVLNLIKELTNPSKNSNAKRSVRKQIDRDHLKNVSWEAKVIKLIDRDCNLNDLSQCSDKGFIKLYVQESKLLLECLVGTNKELEDRLEKTMNALLEGLDKGEKSP